ncbi:MAG TPA: methyltransferase domain-containing protein [Actinophytocola sp.]|uniref:class I SAM-dependent methyltransferase n=1 Tax=Actinophytocola sp. TaxID=1872138 RepID=UPI002DBDA414|nr:methyltransferase domain-containing protein [Actinophytocola sp.]HEU5470121.1 methyltransferase domain-containing protein [Actinophytocola sp.]
MTDQVEALPLTGERTVPGVPEENYWFRRHEAAYAALAPYCAGAVVLEAGCGEGYGADLLARTARLVCGMDYDQPTVRHVGLAYPAVRAVRGNLARLPVRSSTVDVVANLQVIEHLWDQRGFLAECHRVLRPGGRLLVTTPNRLTFSPGRDTPLNPFHTRELDPDELAGLLAEAGFTVELLAGVRHGPRLRALDTRLGGSIIAAQVAVAVGGGAWPPALLEAVTSVTTDDFVVGTTELAASLDLLAVAVR